MSQSPYGPPPNFLTACRFPLPARAVFISVQEMTRFNSQLGNRETYKTPNIFLNTYSRTPLTYVPLSKRESKFHNHKEQPVLEEFIRKFHKLTPTRANIQILVNKFQRTGNVADAPRSGRSAVPKETVTQIREAIECIIKHRFVV
ncbi:hypothetical protein ANN_21082 [Periplaneta americana]|uniref:DUF4817 domain-containing protein n=1 Tax=Periplaneta americana TaxID=6978 RepID=A0ABQ8SED8_PERAM|nr:hypothetical protein ANN_21082 [Periplaneta americana]